MLGAEAYSDDSRANLTQTGKDLQEFEGERNGDFFLRAQDAADHAILNEDL
jgi:hypothetical protein